MSESPFLRHTLLRLTELGFRVFRQNVGQGWIGKAQRVSGDGYVYLETGDVYIKNARPLHAGLCVGSSDIIGWRSITITPEMVGQKIGQFVAIETKTARGRLSKEQENFIEQVKAAGGYAEVARES